jgi:hypothetical protein
LNALRVLVAVAAIAPAGALALEPRFDHRDEQGLVLEPLMAYDVVAVPGHVARSSWRPALRLAYGWDALGEGNELLLGVQGKLGSWQDREREEILLALDARYRAYFGTDQWKTFFEIGVWAPVVSRLAVGPLVTLGVAYDFSRSSGVYLSGGFETGIGEARIASFSASAGAQWRF